jgi:hypothetical protein
MSRPFRRVAALCGALLLGSACQAQTLTNEQANKFKHEVLNGDLSVVTVGCPEGYQLQPDWVRAACVLALRLLVEDMKRKGEFGHSICPPPGDSYQPLFDAITEYVSVEKPLYTERAATIAWIALVRKFPCPDWIAQGKNFSVEKQVEDIKKRLKIPYSIWIVWRDQEDQSTLRHELRKASPSFTSLEACQRATDNFVAKKVIVRTSSRYPLCIPDR